MGWLEVKILKHEEKLKISLPLYKRYIDDICFIFPYRNQNSQEFMDIMNSEYSITKFTEERSLTEVVFLDCRVKCREISLYTDLYVKETATHIYVRAQSCHPKHHHNRPIQSNPKKDYAEIAIKTMISRNLLMVWCPHGQKWPCSWPFDVLLRHFCQVDIGVIFSEEPKCGGSASRHCCHEWHRLYRSSFWNCPGGGTIDDVIRSKWFGVIGVNPDGSFSVSVVSGLLFTIATASAMTVLRLSSSSCDAHSSGMRAHYVLCEFVIPINHPYD